MNSKEIEIPVVLWYISSFLAGVGIAHILIMIIEAVK